jgi:dienelactone hydrolase
VKIETIAYEIDGRPYEGKLVFEPGAGPRPGVLMSPNWMGVTAEAAAHATLLGEGRYTVFVADMYGAGKRPAGPAEAGALANPLRAAPTESRRRIAGALDALKREADSRGVLDARRLAAVGFCFGGGNVLDLARSGADVRAVVSIHGDLTSPLPAQPGAIKASVLALHGTADPVAPKEQRDAFEAEMTQAGAHWRMMIFGGVLHAYTDIGANVPGVAVYDESTARQSYQLTHDFIQEAFSRRA